MAPLATSRQRRRGGAPRAAGRAGGAGRGAAARPAQAAARRVSAARRATRDARRAPSAVSQQRRACKWPRKPHAHLTPHPLRSPPRSAYAIDYLFRLDHYTPTGECRTSMCNVLRWPADVRYNGARRDERLPVAGLKAEWRKTTTMAKALSVRQSWQLRAFRSSSTRGRKSPTVPAFHSLVELHTLSYTRCIGRTARARPVSRRVGASWGSKQRRCERRMVTQQANPSVLFMTLYFCGRRRVFRPSSSGRSLCFFPCFWRLPFWCR